MTIAWLSIGSNIGDRSGFLRAAADSMRALPQTKLLAKSSIYETMPVGGVEQDPFLNGVLKIETGLSPRELLAGCQQIEYANGRERKIHWGPRTLDIDILAFGAETVTEPDLKIPHPFLGERAFVLVPWAEVEESWYIPQKGTVLQLLQQLPVLELAGVQKYNAIW